MTIATTISSEVIQNEFTINQNVSGDQTLFDITAMDGGGFAVIYGNASDTAHAQELDSDLNLTDQTLMSGVNLAGGSFDVTDAAITQTPDGFLFAVLDVDSNGGGYVGFEFGRNQNGEVTFPDDFVISTVSADVSPEATVLTNGTVVAAHIGTNGGDTARFFEISTATNSASDNLIDAAQNQDIATAALEGGGFVVAYTQAPSFFVGGPTAGEVTVQRFDAGGNAVGSPFQPYNQDIFVGDVQGVELVGLPGGGFAMAIDDGGGVALQVFDAFGNNVTAGSAQSLLLDGGDEADISLTIIDDGYLALSFTFPFSGTDDDVKVQLFELDGTPINGTFVIAQAGVDEFGSQIAGSQANDGVFLTAFNDASTSGDGSGSSVRGVAHQIVRTHQGDGGIDDFSALQDGSALISQDNYRDVMRGGGNSDFLIGFGGRDDLFGEAGNDVLALQEGHDAFGSEVFDGGADTDTLRLIVSAGDTGQFDLTDDTVTSIERFEVQALDAVIPSVNVTLDSSQLAGGGTKAVEFAALGTNGANEIVFTVNTDESVVNFSNATFANFGDANDRLVINVIDGGGINVVVGSGINDEINGSGGADFLQVGVGEGVDTLRGGGGNDTLLVLGGSANNTAEIFDGGSDRDSLVLAFNDDAFFDFTDDTIESLEEFQFVGNGAGTESVSLVLNASQLEENNGAKVGLFSVAATDTADDITIFLNVDDGPLDLGNLAFFDFEGGNNQVVIEGNALGDDIIGSFVGETINGGGGADSLNGGGGADELVGGEGRDTLLGGAGDDRLIVVGDDAIAATETLDGGGDTDTLVLGTGANGSVVFDLGTASILSIERLEFVDPGSSETVNLNLLSSQFGGGGIAETAEFAFDGFGDNSEVIGIVMQGQPLDLSGVTFTGNTDAARFEFFGDEQAADDITGTGLGDTIIGGGGADTLVGDGGGDLLNGGAGGDDIDGGAGFDFVTFADSGRRVQADTTNVVRGIGDAAGDVFTSVEGLIGTRFNDNLRGGAEDNDIRAGNFSDRVFGRGGDDTLNGEIGADAIYGNSGADEMTGGAGRDRFIYFNQSETGVGDGQRDVITDFDAAAGERMEISRFDADTTQARSQSFDFVGLAAFSNTAGELRADQSSGVNTIVQGDVNGDGVADFEIELTGLIDLSAANFLL